MQRSFAIMAGLWVGALCAACSGRAENAGGLTGDTSTDGGADADHVSEPDGNATPPLYTEASSSVTRDTAPGVTPDEVTHMATANLRFGFELYGKVQSPSTPNDVLSPFSVSIAMAMFYAGYDGGTAAEQIAAALHFDVLPAAKVAPAFDALDLALASRAKTGGPDFALDIANSIWARGNVPQAYRDVLAADFGTGVFDVAIDNDPDGVRNAINQWGSDHTSGQIASLLGPGAITTTSDGLRTELVLVDAIRFDADWQTPFHADGTTPGVFTRADGSTVMTSMMSGGEGSARLAGPDYDAYEIPYFGGQTSMVLIVPHAGQVAAIGAKLAGDFVSGVFAGLASERIGIHMPKFSIHGAGVSLNDALKSLGVTDAFIRGGAPPLLGVAAAELGSVVQGASIDVTEGGTKATAVTVGTITSYPGAFQPPPPQVTIASPFFYVLRDVPTNTALFVGRYFDPSAN
jgi:serpin B